MQSTVEEREPCPGRGTHPQHGPAPANGWFLDHSGKVASPPQRHCCHFRDPGTVSRKISWKWFKGCAGGGHGRRRRAGRWAAPPDRPRGEPTFSLLLMSWQLGGSLDLTCHITTAASSPIPRKGCTRRSRKGLTAGELRTKQEAACAVSHPPSMSYSDPTSSETENPPYEDFWYLE